MRIGIIAHSLEGQRKGVARYLSNILKEWVLHCKDDEFILYLRSEIQKDSFLREDNVKQIVVGAKLKGRLEPIWENFFLPWRAWKDNIDILFSPSYTLPIISHCKTAVVLHDISFDTLSDPLPWKYRTRIRFLSRYSAKRSNIVFTISEFSKIEIIKFYNIAENKIKVTCGAVDPLFHLVQDKSLLVDFKQRYRLANDYILYVGSMFKRRNVDSLIKAFKIVLNKIPKSQLVLIGRIPSEDNNILNLIQDKSISDHIIQINYVEDCELNLFYNAAGVLVYPSSYEGFGLPPLEAMRCGIPVIVSRFASLPEVVGNAGIFVDPRNPDDIADKIYNLLLNLDLRKDCINNGFKQAAQFSWTRCAKETYDVLNSIVNLH
jgi:glycosyltransferase involved in cell wall biosynthesis